MIYLHVHVALGQHCYLLLFEYLEIFGTAVTRTISVRTIGRVAARTLCNISIAQQRTFINQIPLFWKGNVFLAKKRKVLGIQKRLLNHPNNADFTLL